MILDQVFEGLTVQHVSVALMILVISLGVAWLFRYWLFRVFHNLARKTKSGIDDVLVGAFQKPFVALIAVTGAYLAIRLLPWKAEIGQYVGAVVLLAIGLLGLYVLLDVVNAVLKWYEKQLAGKRQFGLTTRILGVFRIGAMVTGVVIGIVLALGIFGIQQVPVTEWLSEHGWRIGFIVMLALLAVVLAGQLGPRVIAATISRRSGESTEEVTKRADTLARVFVNVVQIFALLVAAFMILSELKIDIAPILAAAGVIGIALGFGAQSLVKDVLAGVFIILENQYRVGDVARIADVAGLVEDINLRRTVLRDLDGIVHYVPNGEIRVASNFTKEWSRVNLNVSVSYNEDLDHVIAVVNRVCQELAEDPEWMPLIIGAPRVLRVDNLGDSGIEIKILGETKPIRQWDVTGELRKRLKKAFDAEGIEIPWPHTKVYFGNQPPIIKDRT
ncbi:MAG: mechanosensitive ion channel domain-containing protein [Chloroflexota bacterium]